MIPLSLNDICLFLDIDGTLAEFVDDPDQVELSPSLIVDLAALEPRLGGALALVSGRSILKIDELMSPLKLPAAGLHGFERRDAAGRIYRRSVTAALDVARSELRRTVAAMPGVSLEDKGAALAVHFRVAPAYALQVESAIQRLMPSLEPDFECLLGDCVLEIKPASHDKGSAIMAFMQEPPFIGRTPIFVGDDITDDDAFAAVRRQQGIAIAVGERVRSEYRLADPADVRRWLRQLINGAAMQQ